MAESKLAALAPKFKENPGLKDQIKKATSLDQVVSIMKSAGVQITKAELLKSEAQRVLTLSDAQLEAVVVSQSYTTDTFMGCATWVFQCCG